MLCLFPSDICHLQGTIVDSDLQPEEQSTVSVCLHPGYGVPAKGHRVICFHPDTGIMIPQYQMVAQEIEDLGDGHIKVSLEGGLYKPEFEHAVELGNFIAIEVTISIFSALLWP